MSLKSIVTIPVGSSGIQRLSPQATKMPPDNTAGQRHRTSLAASSPAGHHDGVEIRQGDARQPVHGGMAGLDPEAGTAGNYRRFARQEAADRSPAYEQLAMAVAGDAAILGFLRSLPWAKRQPNLLFAAARWVLGSPPEI